MVESRQSSLDLLRKMTKIQLAFDYPWFAIQNNYTTNNNGTSTLCQLIREMHLQIIFLISKKVHTFCWLNVYLEEQNPIITEIAAKSLLALLLKSSA
jgi:hypothetical protein